MREMGSFLPRRTGVALRARAAAGDLVAADQRLEHAVEVVVALGQPLSGDRACHRVAEEASAEPRKSREPVATRDALTMDYERVARRALEDVCSGKDPAGIAEVHHPQFVTSTPLSTTGPTAHASRLRFVASCFPTCASSSTSRCPRAAGAGPGAASSRAFSVRNCSSRCVRGTPLTLQPARDVVRVHVHRQLGDSIDGAWSAQFRHR